MKFVIDSKVFDKFPNLTVAIPVIMGFNNTKSQEEALSFLRAAEAELREKMTRDSLWLDKRAISYFDCFKGFGVDPKKFIPAHVALTARVLEGKNLPDINPMVNLYNAMSIKYLTPFGGENLDSLYGDFVLKIAIGGEQWIPIGSAKSKQAVHGELIWRDHYDVSTRALNWRQCDRTKMTGETKNGYFIMDGFTDVNKDNIKIAGDDFLKKALKLFGGKGSIYWLDRDHQETELPFRSKKVDKTKMDPSKGQKVQMDNKPKLSKSPTLPQLFQSVNWEGEDSLGFKLKLIIFEAVKNVFGIRGKLDFNSVKIEHPSQDYYGDYSTNIALIWARKVGMKPRELAEKVVEELNKYIIQYQSISYLTDSLSHQDNINPSSLPKIEPKALAEILESASVAGPGFVNLTIRKEYLSSEVSELLNMKQAVISSQISGKKISVEYTDPNPFKEFHLGHLYSNTIGESLARLFEECGATVWRADYYGDVGMHVCKSVWGMMKKMEDEKTTLAQLEKLSITERQKFLGAGYALGVREYEKNEANAEIIRDINYLIYVAAQDILTKKKGWKPIINYKQYIKGKEKHLEKIYKIYEAGLRWSLAYFETIYKRLGTKFDGYYPESWVGEYGMKLVEEGLAKGIMEKHEGAVIFKGEKYGLHTRVFINKLGLPTYEAKELGLAPAKYENFKYDASVIVTGNEIKEYFYVLLTVLRLIKPELGNITLNLSHGMVRLPQGKMSSRTGNVVTFEGLMDESKKQSLKIMKDVDLASSEKQKVAEAVALAAIRYALLKSSPGNDVVFDFEKSVTFEGDSGPYLMYTYARCKSVLRKAEKNAKKQEWKMHKLFKHSEFNPEELSILRTLYKFPEVVTEAARTLSPNLVCNYLFDLAQKYNMFYNKHSILGQKSKVKSQNIDPDTTEFRLALTEATSIILKRGLHLLGIETVERM